MILIGDRADNIAWNDIRAEYIGGGTSYRKLAKKYQIPVNRISERGSREGWVKLAQKARDKALAKSVQKTANIAADNATRAARIRGKLLAIIEREVDNLPDAIGSESHTNVTENVFSQDGRRITKVKEAGKSYRIRDLAAAFKDLTADMAMNDTSGNELLESLIALERKADNDRVEPETGGLDNASI